MANVLAHLSSILIPAVIFFIIGYGWIHKCDLYDDFINGAADGLKTVVGIVPTLIGLMMAVGILRGSGLLDLRGKLLQKNADMLHMASVETAKESERGIVDIETLKYTNQSLISTLDEVLQIQTDGAKKRQEAETELRRIEGELKQKLLEVRQVN